MEIFTQHYRGQNKKIMNARFLKLLGLNGSDDFYAAITHRGTHLVISSRQSQDFKALILAFQSSFTINMKYDDNTKYIHVAVTDANKTELLHGNIAFTDTGGKSAIGKSNFRMDFSRFLP